MATREENIAARIEASVGSVDFNGVVYTIREPIELQRFVGVKWREVNNLILEIHDDFVGEAAIIMPLYAGNEPRKMWRNLNIRGNDNVAGIIGLINRTTGTNFDHCKFENLGTGISLRGANLNTFTNCEFSDNVIGIQLDRRDDPTPPASAGYVGNDNRFIGCHVRNNTSKGYYAPNQLYEVGGSPGNGTSFIGCTIEGTTHDLFDIEATQNFSLINCRLESQNTAAETHYCLKLSGSGDISDVTVMGCNFVVGNTHASGTQYGIFAEDGANAVYAINNYFDTNASAGTATAHEGPMEGTFNESGPETQRNQGSIYISTAGSQYGLTSTPTVVTTGATGLDIGAVAFDQPSSGQLRYTGSESANFLVRCVLNMSTVTGSLTLRTALAYYDASAETTTELTNTRMESPTVANGTVTHVHDDIMTLDENDYIIAYAWVASGTCNATIHAMRITALRIS